MDYALPSFMGDKLFAKNGGIMRAVIELVGAVVLVCGISLFADALFTSARLYPTIGREVYPEVTFYAVLAVAAFVLSGVLLLAANRPERG